MSPVDSAFIVRSISFLDAEAANAKDINSWCLSILAGSILVFIGTSYIKPATRKAKLIYLLFLPGWFCLGNTFYHASKVTAVSIFHKRFTHQPSMITTAVADVYDHIDFTYSWLYATLLIFCVWLLSMLALWIFEKDPPPVAPA